ncbi:MAG TPA: hypothetical protein IAC02_02720 [Candidatus Coprovivens excrementavium]|nr:hypothetical protein [Candidatus Coprovivens excrementavium]
MMKKDIEWLKKEVWKQDIVMNKGYIYTDDLMSIINEVDEPEVLSQEFIDEHEIYIHDSNRSVIKAVPVDRLQNLLVPKQGELETKIQELIESYKQEEDAYSNPENGWISGFVEDLKNLVAEEPLYYALIKGHELITDKGVSTCKYWNFNTYNSDVFPNNRLSKHGIYLTKMSKSEWNKLGINDSNADFVEVEN